MSINCLCCSNNNSAANHYVKIHITVLKIVHIYMTTMPQKVSMIRKYHNSLYWKLCLFTQRPCYKKWVWSGNTVITHCRQTHSAVRKRHRILKVTRQQEDNQRKATSSHLIPLRDDCKTGKDIKFCKTIQVPNTKPPQKMGVTINNEPGKQFH